VRVILDNNILISALWSAQGPPAQILAAYRAGRFSLVMSEPILEELTRVLEYDHIRERVPAAQGAVLLELLRSGAERVEIPARSRSAAIPRTTSSSRRRLPGAWISW
jgi:putative PIN family toxin of toxin-antitoxin system